MARKHFLPILLFAASGLWAQPIKDSLPKKATPLDEILISSFHINDSLMNAPASVGILSKADLQRNNLSDISTQMNTIPGVLMQSSNIATNRISIRGIGARTTYGTNKIRAFYGSIPLTSGDSETTIEDIDIENISQVEIIKGPLSTLYGAGLGGAIVLTPNTFRKTGNMVSASSVHGSFGLMKNSLNYNLNTKSSSLNLGYHKLETDGWRNNSAYYREGITLAGELFRAAKSKLAYFGNYTWLKAFIPSSIDRKTFDENPRSAAKTWGDAKGYKQYESVLGGLAYDWKLSKNIGNSTSVFVNYKDNYEPRPFDILGQYTFAYGARTQFSGDFKMGKMKMKAHLGLEYFHDEFDGSTSQNLYQNNSGNGSLEGNWLTKFGQQREFYTVFAQVRLLLSKQFELQSALSLNQTKFNLDNIFPYEAASSENYSYDAIWSPQASVLYKPDAFHTLYISASRGFSLPSIAETLTAEGTINPNIKPETGWNYEIGGKLYFFGKKLYTEIALYRMQIKDLLVAERVGDDQYVGVNAGETLHQGIEILVNYHWRIAPKVVLNPSVSASLGQYEFKQFNDRGNDFSGNELTGVPSNTANAGLVLNTDCGWYLSGDFLFVDRMPLNDANTDYNAAYRILNAKTGWRFEIFKNLNAHIACGINNALNKAYASLILPNATGVGTAQPRYYYPGLPVNYYANVALSFTF